MLERRLRRRFWFEIVAALIGFVLALLTLAWPEWIEEIFNVEPDGGNGMAEWGIVLAFFALSAGLAITAHHEWRRAPAR